jgi:mannose-6-phosphate isomerase-like protein (cupin superfamily)
MKVRRVVTGHDRDGKAVVAEDTMVEPITPDLLPGYEFHRLWGTDERPTFPDDGSPRPHVQYFPPADGTRFAVFTLPPVNSSSLPDGFDIPAGFADLEEKLPGMVDHLEPDEPGMHTTDTIDYDFVVSGEAILELDDGEEIVVRAGDAVVQNGTRHRWRNVTSEPCVLLVVLIGADRADDSGG